MKAEGIGEFDIPGFAAKFSRWTPPVDAAADRLGGHNAEVLRELLSLDDDEIGRLYAEKIIVRDPLLDGKWPDSLPSEGGPARPRRQAS